MFKITGGKGFQLTFANGVTASVQFGPGNYCENRDESFDAPKRAESWECENAEVAFWFGTGKWCTKQVFANAGKEPINDDVAGWIKTDEILELMAVAAQLVVIADVAELPN